MTTEDRTTMGVALIASRDTTKDFTSTEADGISFDVTMMDTTKMIKMVAMMLSNNSDSRRWHRNHSHSGVRRVIPRCALQSSERLSAYRWR